MTGSSLGRGGSPTKTSFRLLSWGHSTKRWQMRSDQGLALPCECHRQSQEQPPHHTVAQAVESAQPSLHHLLHEQEETERCRTHLRLLICSAREL